MGPALQTSVGAELEAMIAASPVAAVISNPRLPDNPIIACNAAFEALTGYGREDVIGRNCRFLRGDKTEPGLTGQLRAAIVEGRPVLVELVNYRKDGSAFRNAVMIAPIFSPAGGVDYFLGSQVDLGQPGAVEGTARALDARERIAALTARQAQILRAMAAGQLNKQIAFELGLSERTIKMHRAGVIRALGVRTSAEAIRLAVEAGW